MSRPIPWTYDAMHAWYGKHDTDAAPPVAVIVYEAMRPKKKDVGRLEPFVKPNIRYVCEFPFQDRAKFPDGVYMLMEAQPGHRKWLFAVYPTWKECNGARVLLGDHMTWVVQPNDAQRPCHFHTMNYTCEVRPDGYYEWAVKHRPDHFALALELPRVGTVDAIIHSTWNQYYKGLALDIMRHPWLHGAPGSSGGGRKARPTARPILSPAFSRLWQERGYRHMEAIGLRLGSAGGMSWAVSFLHSGERHDRLRTAHVFHTATEDEAAFQEALVGILSS